LILHDFNTAGYNLPESVVDALVDEEIRAEYSDRKTLTKTLQAQGRTYEKFRQRVRDKFIERALRAKNISQEIIISPHKVEAFYQAHREDFKVEDEVKLRLLTLPQSTAPGAPAAKKMADEILLKLKEGATFAEMAALYSLAKQEGVWYEWSTLTKHLADIAAPMQAGQHTGVMSRSAGEDDYWVCRYENGQATQGRHYGISGSKERLMEEVRFDSGSSSTNLPPPKEYFLMLLEDKRAAHYKPLNEVRTKIEGEFTLQERARLEKQWMERLKKKTFVRVFPGG
jgi:transposase